MSKLVTRMAEIVNNVTNYHNEAATDLYVEWMKAARQKYPSTRNPFHGEAVLTAHQFFFAKASDNPQFKRLFDLELEISMLRKTDAAEWYGFFMEWSFDESFPTHDVPDYWRHMVGFISFDLSDKNQDRMLDEGHRLHAYRADAAEEIAEREKLMATYCDLCNDHYPPNAVHTHCTKCGKCRTNDLISLTPCCPDEEDLHDEFVLSMHDR